MAEVKNEGKLMSHFAFVDAGNLYRGLEGTLKNAKLPPEFIEQLDPANLVAPDFDRVYLYHGAVEGDPLPNWLEEWRSKEGVILRLGRTTRKASATKQEGVDVLLAVEALRCSHMKTMTSCTIFSEDGDFLPLVDALVMNGTITYVKGFNDPNQGTVRPELRNRADGYSRFQNHEICAALRGFNSGVLGMNNSVRSDDLNPHNRFVETRFT